jgi:hypothetical protein
VLLVLRLQFRLPGNLHILVFKAGDNDPTDKGKLPKSPLFGRKSFPRLYRYC